MKDPRLQALLARLRVEFPEFVVAVRPYHLEEYESIEHFINLLLVPSEQLHDVAWRAWGLALEIYGDDATPFLMTSVSPESSIEHFGEALAVNAAHRLDAGFSIEALSSIPLDLEGITITCSVETLFSGLRAEGSWLDAGVGLLDPWPLVETLLLAPDATKLPTSVRPGDPRSNFSLAA